MPNKKNKTPKMNYEAFDNTERDIYKERNLKRDKYEEYSSNSWVVWSSIAAAIATFIFITFGYSMIHKMIDMVFSDQKTPGFFNYYLNTLSIHFDNYSLIKCIFVYVFPFVIYAIMYAVCYKRWKVNNLHIDTANANDYEGDARLTQPEELPIKFDVFPDAGAHSSTPVTAIIGHMMLDTNGLNKTNVYDRVEETYNDGDEIIPRNSIKYKSNGDSWTPIYKKLSIIDKKFGDKLFDSAKLDEKSEFRIFYDATKLQYNPKKIREKQNYDTVADHINNEWYLPAYEPQRPGGMYIVDTQPNNTINIAMSRGNKGQTFVEPTLDAWLRTDDQANIVANDSKGELYVKFYYRAVMRGYTPVAFNVMNKMKTDNYNPLGYAVDAARQGDVQQATQLVGDISEIFFPISGSEEKFWPQSARAVFERTALGMIDYYLEEENRMREVAEKESWNPNVLNQKLDEMWGVVTLENTYHMATQLSAKKTEDKAMINVGNDKTAKEKDYLSIFFDATSDLPLNELRSSIDSKNKQLQSLLKSEKTIASIYGIALAEMEFFTEKIVSQLTSSRPSQNFDMYGLGFPRRFSIRFNSKYMKKYNLKGMLVKWSAYNDSEFTESLGKDFEHESIINLNGWSDYVFKGKFPNKKGYIHVEIIDDNSKLPLHDFYFEFIKGFKKDVNGVSFIEDPILNERIIHNGSLYEMIPQNDTQDGQFKKEQTKHKYQSYDITNNQRKLIDKEVSAIDQFDIHYVEKPKMLFLVTPPHLGRYNQLVLMAIDQIFNMQVSKAYMLTPDQKPFYPTRSMYDESGNLEANGHGIANLERKESIGLGQSQFITLILQSLSQLTNIYNDNVDQILIGNSRNVVFLQSTDTKMIEQLSKMSGKKHERHVNNINITKDEAKFVNNNNSLVNESYAMEEVPVISETDLLQIPSNNSIVFGHGNPIWNRNQTALPMAYQLFDKKKSLFDPYQNYTIQNIPTINNTMDFDSVANIPNFYKMVEKRVMQAQLTRKLTDNYMQANKLDEDSFNKINSNDRSLELMSGINKYMNINGLNATGGIVETRSEDNQEFIKEKDDAKNKKAEKEQKRFAGNKISRDDLFINNVQINHEYDEEIVLTYSQLINDFKRDKSQFKVNESGTLKDAQNRVLISSARDESLSYHDDILALINKKHTMDNLDSSEKKTNGQDINTIVASMNENLQYAVQDRFIKYLAELDDWEGILDGKFEKLMTENIETV